MELLKDIDQLEASLNIREIKGKKINLEDLDSPDFDLQLFIRNNFLLRKEGKRIDYEMIEDSISHINQI